MERTKHNKRNTTRRTFKAGTEHRTNTIRELVRPVITPSSSPHARLKPWADGRGRVLSC